VNDDLTPARPDEVADALQIMRAALAGLAAGRKDYRLKVTKRQRERAVGALVRVALTTDGNIEVWLEAPTEAMRTGVVYLGPNHPRAEEPA
jgi:hypothetical protein